MEPQDSRKAPLIRYRPWFYAAAIYNLAWGTATILFPGLLFRLIEMEAPNYLSLWQVVGMFVLVYAPAYWWAGRFPERHPHLVLIGLVGKVLGPLGFAWSFAAGRLPVAFGLTILANDLVWWPAFILYLRDAARQRGGWLALLSGE
jgi:hypothetical protein